MTSVWHSGLPGSTTVDGDTAFASGRRLVSMSIIYRSVSDLEFLVLMDCLLVRQRRLLLKRDTVNMS